MSGTWKTLFGSACGTSHERRGEPCQDYAHGRTFHVGESSILILACADGAGSATHAQIGARLACLSFIHAAAVPLENGLRIADITNRHVTYWHQQARQRLSMEACVSNLNLGNFACTLLTTILGQDSAVFSQIGDGAIVVGDGSAYRTVFWPQSGEYANTTFFLTGECFEEQLEFRSYNQPVDELALLTDGLQPLALHYASRSVHAPFFAPMFQSLRTCLDPEQLEGPLRQFLDSKHVNGRTDDDKTLVLATRRSPTDGNL
jgi:hypothetical protein